MTSRILTALTAVFLLAVGASASMAAGNGIGPDEARTAAIKILKGDPYGSTAAEVAANIAGQEFATHKLCSPDQKNWVFRIAVPASDRHPDGIRGYLVIDAQTGEMICAGLPFLD